MSRDSRSLSGRRIVLLLVACMIAVAFGVAPSASAYVRVSAGVRYNSAGYDLLSEYGEWIDLAPYGVVWVPYVDESWAPFSDGQWIWTSYGWAWDSYEPFGELVFHYGYWYFDNDIGWFWVPGDEWSPARVQWYTYLDYCAWAPLPPPHYYWPDPWIWYDRPIWIVVHVGDFCDDHIWNHRIDYRHHRDIWGPRDRIAGRAPDYRRVERITHRDIPVRTIERRPMDIRKDQIRIADRGAVARDRSQVRDRSNDRSVIRDRGSERDRSVAPNRVKPRQEAPVQRNDRSRREIVSPRSVPDTRREVITPRSAPDKKREVVAPRSGRETKREVAPRTDRTSKREAATPRPSPQREQRSAVTRSSSRTEQRVAPRRSDASRSAEVSRRPEAPSRSAQPARSQAPDRSSSNRSDKVKQRNSSK